MHARLSAPCAASGCAGYLCPLSANTFGVEFLEFKIREMEGEKRELYHVKKPDDVVRLPLCPLSAPLPLPFPLPLPLPLPPDPPGISWQM